MSFGTLFHWSVTVKKFCLVSVVSAYDLYRYLCVLVGEKSLPWVLLECLTHRESIT